MLKLLNAEPANIGKVVSIQVFRRKDGDDLDRTTLVKYVGKLISYKLSSDSVLIVLNGLPMLKINDETEYIEIYTLP